MMVFGEIDKGSYIISRLVVAVPRGGRGMEYLGADGKPLRNMTLRLPAHIPVILVAGAGIDPVTSPAIRLPRPKAFLEPERQE